METLASVLARYKVRLFKGAKCYDFCIFDTPMECLKWVAEKTVQSKGFEFHYAECTNADGAIQWQLNIG